MDRDGLVTQPKNNDNYMSAAEGVEGGDAALRFS
jgi:hypothetical protein